MSSDDKPEPKTASPIATKDEDQSSPNLDDLDSSWGGEDEDLDSDATTVARIPQELMALSRRGQEAEKPAPRKSEEPEKHDAITARPPPPGQESVVVDAPHERLDKAPEPAVAVAPAPVAHAAHAAHAAPVVAAAPAVEEDDEDDEDEEEELDWDIPEDVVAKEEERAAAADEAAGLDAEARRKAAEERAAARAARREKARSKVLAAKEKRRARADAQKQKQKKPKKRSTPPPPREQVPRKDSRPPASRERVTGRPAPIVAEAAVASPRRDLLRMVFFVAIVVVLGAFVIGLARR